MSSWDLSDPGFQRSQKRVKILQGATKGVRQKELDHFFSFSGRFRSLFGLFF